METNTDWIEVKNLRQNFCGKAEVPNGSVSVGKYKITVNKKDAQRLGDIVKLSISKDKRLLGLEAATPSTPNVFLLSRKKSESPHLSIPNNLKDVSMTRGIKPAIWSGNTLVFSLV